MKSIKAPPDDWRCEVLISRIPKNGEPYRESFELPLKSAIEHWRQDYSPCGPVSVDAEFAFTGERVLASISVKADFILPCSRCLSETGLAIIGNLRYLFTLRPLKDYDPDDDETFEEDGDVGVISVDSFQAELDVTRCVWEVLLLSLPERALCSEDCKGLCPICGHNRNESDCGCREDDTDPRLAVLRDLDV